LPVKFVYGTSSVHMEESLSDEEIIQTSIGQGKTQITPLHLNMITNAIANNGTLMKPYLIDCVTNSDNSIVKQFKSSSYGKLITEDEAKILQDLMKEVVNNGTATFLKSADYTSAGKTGSAEYNSKGDSHAWFTGFAPAENPKVCVTIIVEGAGSGGDYAVPMAKRLFDTYFEEFPLNEE
ncbi:MAG: penicillin-binding protein 2, partial [Lachnospiraceae bacterium]|nr:penicillin-binding protein 2 [Lachnospiraceae bacterium]